MEEENSGDWFLGSANLRSFDSFLRVGRNLAIKSLELKEGGIFWKLIKFLGLLKKLELSEDFVTRVEAHFAGASLLSIWIRLNNVAFSGHSFFVVHNTAFKQNQAFFVDHKDTFVVYLHYPERSDPKQRCYSRKKTYASSSVATESVLNS